MTNPQKQVFDVDVTLYVDGKYRVEAWNSDDAYRKVGDLMSKGVKPTVDTTEIDMGSIEIQDAYPVGPVENRKEASREIILDGSARAGSDRREQSSEGEQKAVEDFSRAIEKTLIDALYPTSSRSR